MERVRFGLVGLGTWGKIHADTYSAHPRSCLAAVCDLDEERRRKAAAHYGVTHIYTDYGKMLSDNEIDAVAVVTPDFAHRNIEQGLCWERQYRRIHAIDSLRYLFQDEILRVYSVSRSGVLRARGVDVPDIYQTILELGNGAIATMENHWIMPDSNPQLNDFKVNILGRGCLIWT
jgi:predicted dehydrogenase